MESSEENKDNKPEKNPEIISATNASENSSDQTKENIERSSETTQQTSLDEPDFFDKLGNKAIWLALGLAACIATYVYWDFITLERVLLYTDIGSDSVNIFYPVWAHYADLWREPGMPSWSMQMAMGQNVGFAGIPDPFFMIYVLVGKSNIPFTIVFVEITKVLLTTLFIFKYLKYLKLKNLTCIIGSLLFAFSGYMIMGTSGWPHHSHEALFVSLFLFMTEKFIQTRKFIYLVIFSFIMAWTNFVLLFQEFAFLLFYLPFRLFLKYDNLILSFKKSLPGILGFITGSIFAFPSLFNAFKSTFNSGRADVMINSEQLKNIEDTSIFTTLSSDELTSVIFRFFSNDILGTGSNFKGWFNYLESPILYISIPILLFCTYFLLNNSKKQIHFFIAGLAILLLFFPWFRNAYWGFKLNYFRSFSFFISIIFFYLGIQGINEFFKTGKQVKSILVMASVLLSLLFIYPGNNSGKIDGPVRMSVSLFLLGYAMLTYFYEKGKNRQELKWSFLLLIIFELGVQASTSVNKRNSLSEKDIKSGKLYGDSTLQVLAWLKKQDSSFYRIAKYYPSGPAEHMSMNDAMVQGFNGLIGYSSMHQKYYMRFLTAMGCIDVHNPDDQKWTYKILSRPILCSFVGAKYFLDKSPMKLDTTLFQFKAKKFGIYVYESKIAMPIAIAYDTYLTEKNFKKLSNWNKDYVLFKAIVIDDNQLQDINGLKEFDLRDTITKENKTAFLLAAKQQQSLLKHKIRSSNKLISGNLETSKPCVITFSIPFDENWKLQLNGKDGNYFVGDFGFITLKCTNNNLIVYLIN